MTTGNVGVSRHATFRVIGPGAAGSAALAPAPPAASFTWFPTVPRPRETGLARVELHRCQQPDHGLRVGPRGQRRVRGGGPGDRARRSRRPETTWSGCASPAPTDCRAVATETIPVGAASLPLMQPFPVVRIASTDTASGIRLRVLRVLAPAGARIAVSARAMAVRSSPRAGSPPCARWGRRRSNSGASSVLCGPVVVLEIRISRAGRDRQVHELPSA